jgi:hypothetical protein
MDLLERAGAKEWHPRQAKHVANLMILAFVAVCVYQVGAWLWMW